MSEPLGEPVDGLVDGLVVAADLDGTLLDSGHRVTPRTIAAIARVRRAGGRFVAVTARPLRDAAGIARTAGADLLVCAGGGLLFEPVAGRVVSSFGFPPGVADRLVAGLRTALPGVRIGIDDGRRCTLDPGFDMGNPGSADVLARAPVAVGAGPVVKLILQAPGLDTDALAGRLRELLGDGPVVAVSCVAFTEILPAGVDKATHLRRLYPAGIDLAFGDMCGDLPFLSLARTAVAMGNAHPAVLAAADRVTGTNDEDGVAVVLEQLCPGPDHTALSRTG